MTAEIVVMNKIAVALAADSAASIRVTRGNSTQGVKVYAANKLFRLEHTLPVGVLVYGSAEFMGVPWEVLIKEYRATLRDGPKKRLSDYAEGFTAFLKEQNWLSGENFPKVVATSEMHSFVGPFVAELAGELNRKLGAALASGNLNSAPDLEETLKAAANAQSEAALQLVTMETARLAGMPKFEDLSDDTEAKILGEYRQDAEQLVDRLLAQQPIFQALGDKKGELRNALVTLAMMPLKHQPPGELPSGIVFAGFGAEEHFPSMKVSSYRGILAGMLQWKPDSQRSGSISRENPASVVGFAQADMIHTFMFGTDPALEGEWRRAFESFIAGIPTSVKSAMVDAAIGGADKIADALSGYLKIAGKSLVDKLGEAQRTNHAHPFIQLVGHLSKDEMAELAESLIRLTSLKRRVTMAEETVGGPIDVAVISRGEGFVYVKRKHYFDLKLNPHYVRIFEEVKNETKKSRKATRRKAKPNAGA